MSRKNIIRRKCAMCGTKVPGGLLQCPKCGGGIFVSEEMEQLREEKIRHEQRQVLEEKALRLREWANHSQSVTALLALGPSSDGSFSLASKNTAIWAVARSAEEQQVMLFVVLSAATLVLIKHNKTGDGVAALLGAMNVVDGIPDFAPLVVAFQHAVAALEDIEQHQGHKDESKRSELLQKSQDLEKNWGEMAAALLKKFGGRSFLE